MSTENVPNNERGEFLITIAGKEFVIVPTFEKIQKLESAIGMSLVKLLYSLQNDPGTVSFDVLAKIVSILAKDSGPATSISKIGSLMLKQGLLKSLEVLKIVAEKVLKGDEEGNEVTEGS